MAEKLWKFHRLGGLDQVTLHTADDFLHLDELDPKLWVALSCPSSGLELNDRTMALIDTDRDGRIRVPEVTAAVTWLAGQLKDPATIADPPEKFPLSLIRDDTDSGRRLLATGREILKDLGREGSEWLTCEEVMEASKKAGGQLFNGDGILPPDKALGNDLCGFIEDGLKLIGGVMGVDGRAGLNRDLGRAFVESLNRWRHWRDNLEEVQMPLSAKDTAEAWNLMEKLGPKIDDYFLRADLAAFAPNSTKALNPDFEENGLDLSALKDLPLAWVEPDRPLSRDGGLNPAWRAMADRFLTLAEPLLARPGAMTRDDWPKIRAAFSGYGQAMSSRPAPVAAPFDSPPASSFETLDERRVDEILSGSIWDEFQKALSRDVNSPESDVEVTALERLVLYHRHIYRLLMNFVSFHDFYSADRKAAFQAGVLHIDGRECCLCLTVGDVEKHAAMSAHSHLCLIYCQCRRAAKPGGQEPEVIKYIVAAITDGDADFLMEGRNGVFVDNDGQDWDATIIKYVPNTIGLRQAVWDPYKRISRLVGDQINKLALSGDDKLINAAGQTITKISAAQPAAKAAQPFDIGKSVGIFAAIGLALGALGTALATIARALFSLHWWQFPLLFVGLFLIISGPSVILAWLKLRKRTLGPMLDASGWAINSQVPINLMLGGRLTSVAKLPPNASRSFNDPLQPPRKKWPILLLAAVVIGAAAFLGWKMTDKVRDLVMAPPEMAEPATPEPVTPEPAAATEAPAPPAPEAAPASEPAPAS